jgi:probable phosphoglycerate mutase
LADIWLLRHAAYQGHRPGHHAPPDAPLTPKGRTQLHRLLPLPAPITALVTSPLLRARQTAETLHDLTGLPILATTDLLAEWRAPTAIHGRTAATYPPAYRAWRNLRATHPDLPYEDGESLTALHTRATHCAAYLRHVADHHEGDILAISHQLLLATLVHLPSDPTTTVTTATQTLWPFATLRPYSSDLELS